MSILRHVIGIGVGCLSMAAVAFAQAAGPAFKPAGLGAEANVNASQPSTVSRARHVQLTDEELPTDVVELRLNFFPDADFTMQVDRKEARGEADYTLFGPIKDVPLGHCTLVVQGGGHMDRKLRIASAGHVSDPV